MDLQQEKEELLRGLSELAAKSYIKSHTKIYIGLQELHNDIQRDFYTIVVLGEFKRGKSTLVNALLGTKLLPMDVLPETATINAIMYNEEPKLTVVHRDGTAKNGEVSYDFLKQYSAREEGSEAENVRYIKIGYPCELLKNRIVMVDTPGVSDLNEQRSEVTYQFVPNANAVLFVLDANAPLKKTEKEFIDERLLPLGINNIVFVINKYDAVEEDEEEEFLDNVKKRLYRAFNMDDAEAQLRDISIYPLSAKMALQGLEQGNDKLLIASGLKSLLDKLQEMVFAGNMERQKIQSYKKRLCYLLSTLEREIQREKTLKEADISELEEAASALQQMLQEKASQESNVSGYVSSAKNKFYAMTDKSLQYFYAKLKDNCFDLVEEYKSQDFKNFIEKVLPKHIQRNLESWIATYGPHLDELIAMMERELARGLSQQFKQQIQLKTSKGAKLQNISSIFNIEAADISGTGMKANALTAAGAVAAMAVFSPILVPLVSIWGRSKIYNNMLQKNLAEAKADVVPQLEGQLIQTVMEMKVHVHKYIDKQAELVQKNTQYAFETLLEEVKKKIEEQLVAKKQAGDSIQQKMDELTSQAEEIHKYILSLEG